MKRQTKAGILFGLVMAMLLLVKVPSASAESIGIAPTSFDFENLVRGQEYARTITVFHDSEDSRSFNFIASGELAPWITFFEIESGEAVQVLTIENQGLRSKGTVGMRISVPEDAANGFYDAAVNVSAVTGDPTAGSSSASVGASIRVFADVTGEQILSGALLDASAISIETGFPLRFDARFENTGNVRMTPTLDIEIVDSNDEVVLSGAVAVEEIGPQELATRVIEMDVDALRAGDYKASIAASFLGLDLGTKTVAYSIFERGTLTRGGSLQAIEITNDPAPGEVARIVVEFKNTGQIEANAVFVGEITRDGNLVEVVTSLPQLIQAGQSGNIEVFADVDALGEYTLTGKVNFDGKESQPVTLNYSVREQNIQAAPTDPDPGTGDPSEIQPTDPVSPGSSGDDDSLITIIAIAVGVIAVVAGGVGFALYRRDMLQMPALPRMLRGHRSTNS